MNEEFMYGLFVFAGIGGFYLGLLWSLKRDEKQERDPFDDGGER